MTPELHLIILFLFISFTLVTVIQCFLNFHNLDTLKDCRSVNFVVHPWIGVSLMLPRA